NPLTTTESPFLKNPVRAPSNDRILIIGKSNADEFSDKILHSFIS
ncbi:unnamed protein product, partial [marine sediment metagenome]